MKKATNWIQHTVEGHALPRFLVSFPPMLTSYGIFLFLYELKFFRNFISILHPFLVAWAAVVAGYSFLVRQDWRNLRGWGWLALFVPAVLVSCFLNRETGIVAAAKSVVMTLLPLAAFLPYCLSTAPAERHKRFLSVLLAPAVVIFLASLTAYIMYLLRVSTVVEIGGVRALVGLRYYFQDDPNSGLLLYGLYSDTNHAAVYAVFFALYSVLLFLACRNGMFAKKQWNKAGRGFAVANFVIQCLYFPLANSRGGWLALIATLFLSVFLYASFGSSVTKASAKRILLSVLAACIATAVCTGVLIGGRYLSSAASVGVNKLVNFSFGDRGSTDNPEDIAPDDDFALDPDAPALDSFSKDTVSGDGGRLNIWAEALQLYLHKPVFGAGVGNTTYYAATAFPGGWLSRGYALHNSYLDMLVSFGAVGFVLLIGFLISFVWRLLNAVFCGQKTGVTHYILIGSGIFLALAIAFLSAAFVSTTAMYLILLLTIGYLIAQKE